MSRATTVSDTTRKGSPIGTARRATRRRLLSQSKLFYTYAFTPEPATPDNNLGYNDSIAAGSCATPNFYFVTNQNTFGRDEVRTIPTYPLAFYLFLEGYTPNAVGSSIPSFSTQFVQLDQHPRPQLPPDVVPITYDLGGTVHPHADVPQRIRFGYDINFTAASLASATAFPAAGSATPNAYTLQASISILGATDALTPQAEFYLLGGDDPYFTNINTGGRRRHATLPEPGSCASSPALQPSTHPRGPGPGAIRPPTLSDSVTGAYNYIGELITWLNQQYGYLNPNYTPPDTNVSDPLDSLLPHQNGALNGDSSVTPFTGTDQQLQLRHRARPLEGLLRLGRPGLQCQGLLPADDHPDLRHRLHQLHRRHHHRGPAGHLSQHRQPQRPAEPAARNR